MKKRTTIVITFIITTIILGIVMSSFLTGLVITFVLFLVINAFIPILGAIVGFFLYVSDLIKERFGILYLICAVMLLIVIFHSLKSMM